MCGGINAAGQAGGENKSACSQFMREHACQFATGQRGISSADNRNGFGLRQSRTTFHRKQRWRCVDMLQVLWIFGLAEGDKPGAGAVMRFQLPISIFN